jgi:hypothetical protein
MNGVTSIAEKKATDLAEGKVSEAPQKKLSKKEKRKVKKLAKSSDATSTTSTTPLSDTNASNAGAASGKKRSRSATSSTPASDIPSNDASSSSKRRKPDTESKAAATPVAVPPSHINNGNAREPRQKINKKPAKVDAGEASFDSMVDAYKKKFFAQSEEPAKRTPLTSRWFDT